MVQQETTNFLKVPSVTFLSASLMERVNASGKPLYKTQIKSKTGRWNLMGEIQICMNNIVYCGFATKCLARSLRSHHHPVSNKSDNIPARSFASLTHRWQTSPLAYIIAQIFQASPFFPTVTYFLTALLVRIYIREIARFNSHWVLVITNVTTLL